MRKKMLIIGGLIAAVIAIGAPASMQHQPLAPMLTVNERIALVKAIRYEEVAPYLDAVSTFDLEGRARACEGNNNFHLLPQKSMHQWLAKESVRCYAAQGGPKITENFVGKREFGDSPWGFFSTPEFRKVMEPCFWQAKEYFVEILRKQEIEQATKPAQPVARPPA